VFAFVGLVLVDMPLSLGKLPFASRVLVMPWAKTGVAERTMIARAVFIFILLAFQWMRLCNRYPIREPRQAVEIQFPMWTAWHESSPKIELPLLCNLTAIQHLFGGRSRLTYRLLLCGHFRRSIYQGGIASDVTIPGGKIRAFVERIENIDMELQDLNGQKKEDLRRPRTRVSM